MDFAVLVDWKPKKINKLLGPCQRTEKNVEHEYQGNVVGALGVLRRD